MTTYGLTSTGFVPEPLAQIQADLRSALQAAFGNDIDLSASGPFGQLVGIWADREAALWQLGAAITNAAFPDTASGSALDDVCSITGVVRLAATYSNVTVALVGTAGTVVPSGTGLATTPSGTQFTTSAAGTIAAVAAWPASTTVATGTLCTNSGNVYYCLAGGPTAASGGPTGNAASITDGAAVWMYLAAGNAAVLVSAKGATTGALAAPAGTLTTIRTPVAGLTAVNNPSAAVLGAALETDSALRVRRATLLRAQGSAAVASIRAALLSVSGVTAALIYENTGDVNDSSGRPPHSFEAVVQGGADSDVATAIFNSRSAGIATTGAYTPQTVTDSQGTAHMIKFTRPTSVPIYVVANVKKDVGYAGDAAVSSAIQAWAAGQVPALGGTALQIGQTVYASKIAAAILDTVAGVLDVSSVYIGTAASPTSSAPIAMTYAQLATIPAANITVVST